MNKEVEEMMLTIPQKIIAYDMNPKGQHLYGEQRQEIAEVLYNAGYRKIDKDSVVLSREDYEMLVNQYKNLEIKYSNLCDNYRLCKDTNETLKQNAIITRKETAERDFSAIIKLLEMKKASITCHYGIKESVGADIAIRAVKELAKRVGIEIKEYKNEKEN